MKKLQWKNILNPMQWPEQVQAVMIICACIDLVVWLCRLGFWTVMWLVNHVRFTIV